ncbi:hypothetical protein JNUCC1_01670 [Lentibacillus sp. JNUCC-1]|nr:hypothetical protein [Lentibacillus sp. JNUCC-1]
MVKDKQLCCDSEQFIQKEIFSEFIYQLAVLPEQGHLHKIIDTPGWKNQ